MVEYTHVNKVYQYFLAYGANTNLGLMGQNCHGAKLLGLAEISGFQPVFRRGFLTLAEDADKKMTAAVWQVEHKHIRALDKFEEYPDLYDRKSLPMLLDDGTTKANGWIYIMNPDIETILQPESYYIDIVRTGYKQCGISEKQLVNAVEELKEHKLQGRYNYNRQIR